MLGIVTAAAISFLADRERERVVAVFEVFGRIIFGVIRIVMWLAPLGAFGGMAYTVAKFGSASLANLGPAHGHVLGHVRRVRLRRARARGEAERLQHPALHPDDPRRAADHRRHVVVGDGAAAPAREARGRRRVAPDGRHGHPDGVLVQPRRHVHLPHARRAVHRAGGGRVARHRRAARARDADDPHVEGRRGDHGRGAGDARRLAAGLRRDSSSRPRRSPSASRSWSGSTGS